MTDVISKELGVFIRNMVKEPHSYIQEVEKVALENNIPLVEKEVGQLLYFFASMQGKSQILELGTAYGYSTLWLGSAVIPQGGTITTIELNEERYKKAMENFNEIGWSDSIIAHLGDAKEILPQLEGPFDLVFMDAAKGQYPEFLEQIWPKIKKGGILICDNVLLNGWVVDLKLPHRRKKTMVYRLRKFLEQITNHSEMVTSVLPLSDGVSISYKK